MNVTIQAFQSVFENLLSKIETGLTLSNIDNALFFIIFVRFIILAIRYNLKTSFYITCIGIFAGYLWYRHLTSILVIYRNVLFKVPFLSGLGIDAIEMRSPSSRSNITYESIYSEFSESKQKVKYYIDPISMVVSNLKEPYKSKIWPIYYQIYNEILPKIFAILAKFWKQISGILAYVFITRIGKKYCPYLIRWHWTFLIILAFVEQFIIQFIYRIVYFQTYVLTPTYIYVNKSFSLMCQINALSFLMCTLILMHVGFLIFGLFHAIWGQYFYFPFLVENTELHIGRRPTNSIYSGGQTAWQYPDEKNINRLFPNFWFGWFGHGSRINRRYYYYERRNPRKIVKKFIKKLRRRLKNLFRK